MFNLDLSHSELQHQRHDTIVDGRYSHTKQAATVEIFASVMPSQSRTGRRPQGEQAERPRNLNVDHIGGRKRHSRVKPQGEKAE